MSAPEPVYIGTWNETRSRGIGKRSPGVLRVLVGGQHCGTVYPSESGWAAEVNGLRQTPVTYHDTPGDALTAVIRSPWARRLGHRAASRIYFSLAASRALTHQHQPGGAA